MATQFDEVVDVLVVGSGAAGCSAAVSAAKISPSLKIVLCEASEKMVGGTTKLAGGGWLWCPNNPFLEKLGVKQPPEEIAELMLALAYPPSKGETPLKTDVDLIHHFSKEWPVIVRQIIDAKVMKLQIVTVREEEDGVRVKKLIQRKMKETPNLDKICGVSMKNLDDLAGLMPSYCAEHKLDKCPTGKVLAPDGSTTSLQLEKSARALKVDIRMGHRVIDLIVSKGGQVVGVIVTETSTKKQKRIGSRGGVVFACGGFARNQALMEKHHGGAKFAPKGSCSAKTNVGDLITMCDKHTIPVSGMDFAWFKQTVLPYNFPRRLGVFFLNGDGYMTVNKSGKRFASDRDFYQERGRQMIENPNLRAVFFIFDERSWKLFEGPIKGLGSAYPMLEGDEDALIRGSNEEEIERGIKEKLKHVMPDFTLDVGFAKNLKAQIQRFNDMARKGKDTEFNRGEDVAQYCWSVPRAKDNTFPNKLMYPLDSTKLCCLVMGLAVLDTKGGPQINKNGQVLGKDGRPVLGMYAAGNAARSPTRHSYPASGVTLSLAVFYGWMAGKHAAERAMTVNGVQQRQNKL